MFVIYPPLKYLDPFGPKFCWLGRAVIFFFSISDPKLNSPLIKCDSEYSDLFNIALKLVSFFGISVSI